MSEQVLAEEIWKAIPQFEGRYSVSNLGRVMSHKRLKARGGILKPWPIRGGYMAVDLRPRRAVKVHRIVLLTFVGPPPEGMNDANHKNGNRKDNRLENLEWSSRGENMRHAYRVLGSGYIKFGNRGMKNHNAKLTDELVREYRRMAADGMPIRRIARIAGIHRKTIRDAVRKNTWSHVD